MAAEQPYHVFTKWQKWFVIVIIGTAGLFSGLSSNIYFPALDQIAKDLNVSLGKVSLTITSYMVAQGIAPLIWGSFSDTLGRRPIYIASFCVYIAANVGLSYTPSYAVLLIFRAIQAAGSASTVSIGNGVIQDISPPAERGAFIAFYQAIRNFSIAIGPVLGGALSELMGFRFIFVFLLVLSSVVLTVIAFFLPETLRSIAGNGSLRLNGVYQPLFRRLTKAPCYLANTDDSMLPRKKVTVMTFVSPLRLLAERDILFNLIFGGVVYAVWSMVTSSTTRLFKQSFGLSEIFLGLAFLPNGLGTIFGSAIVGRLMTSDFLAAETSYKLTHNLPPTFKIAKSIPADFPIEHARLRHLAWISALFTLSVGCYGFTLTFPALLARPGWIALPLAVQFIIAATSNAVFALNQTIVADLCPGRGASATAVNNLVRCGLGAAGVAVVDVLISSAGVAAAFVGLALITVACAPLAVMNWYWGMEWRGRRMEREERTKMREAEGGQKV
ncbi:major facilitator superfamily domain-containing protein [Bombardia bombarda]|uniref:Major facilitator superfamily domain-containing protein n=1 Tax=Bombardia bombarda TaxID=252184 RepID=A0AA39WBP7_9PEZI|nr:major facilitator superfamily domain-containing protein [Bombardia bombarda]